MILKVPLLIAAIMIWIKTENVVLAASAWGGTIFVLSILIHGFSFYVVLASFLSFIVFLGAAALFEYLEGSVIRWVVAGLATFLLLFVV